MEVKAGYKQTEVGVVPEDWVITKLSSLSKEPMQNGVFFEPARKGRGAKMINVGDLYTKVPINEESLELFDATENEISVFRVENGDLFFTRSSVVPSGIAHCNIFFALHSEPVVFDSHVIRYRPDPKKVSPSYLFRFCVASVARTYLVSHAKTGTMTTIDQGVLGKCPVVLPFTLAEQEAIAAALSDADALIEALEQLLAKKRQVKQGAMQELLRPKNDWIEKKLGETAILKARIGWQGLKTTEYLDTGDYFLVTGTEFRSGYIDWNNCHYVTLSRYKQDKNIQLRERDVLVTKDGTIGKVALITDLPKPATLNSGVFVIRPIDEAFDPEFFYYLLCSNIFIEFLGQLSAGSTINHLYQKDFVNFVYKTPATLAEQTAIAEVLGEMDAEIAALEEKLSKARLVKQGMMQELLTGRVRLV